MTKTKTPQPKQRVLVIGGGFGGVKTALDLSEQSHLSVTLISDRTDFIYYPTLYRTATGGADEQSVIPLRDIFADLPVEVIIDKALTLDTEKREVVLESKERVTYDKLILALGVVTNYFGIPGLDEFSYGIKSGEAAERLKRHLHARLIADHEPDMNYIVVGGGPTGIELAGELGAYLKTIMKKHGIKRRAVHIDLVEAMPHLLPRMPRSVGKTIERRLRKLGVKLYLNSKVEGASADELTVSGKPIRSHTIIWTAGVTNNPFFAQNKFPLSPRGKVLVDEFLRVEGHKHIFVIGDNAETPFSGMAQTALYDAEFVAHNFQFEAENRPKLAYRPKEPVYVTPVGPKWAAVRWKTFDFYGRIGWLLREAADIKAFSELISPVEAAAQWSTVFDREDLCPICTEQV